MIQIYFPPLNVKLTCSQYLDSLVFDQGLIFWGMVHNPHSIIHTAEIKLHIVA